MRDEYGRFVKGSIPLNKGKKTGLPAWNTGKKLSESHKQKLSDAKKGNKYRVGCKHKEETLKKISETSKRRKGCGAKKGNIPWNKGRRNCQIAWNKGKIGIYSEETLRRQSEARIGKWTGIDHPNWKGGMKAAIARGRAKRKERGFILMTDQNPYDEPIEYHHIHPDLPYVLPCPARIHQAFPGMEKTHFQNVNAMLGIKFDFTDLNISKIRK